MVPVGNDGTLAKRILVLSLSALVALSLLKLSSIFCHVVPPIKILEEVDMARLSRNGYLPENVLLSFIANNKIERVNLVC